MTISLCGAWSSPAYRNRCLRCEGSGRTVNRSLRDTGICLCCKGTGWHPVANPGNSRPFPAYWQR